MHESRKRLFIDAIFFTLLIANIGLFWRTPIIATLVALLIFFVAAIFFHTKEDVIFYVCGMILGPLAEIICVNQGAWTYTAPTFLGIPLWLPFVWGFAFLIAKRIKEALFTIEHWHAHHVKALLARRFEFILLIDSAIYVLLIMLVVGLWRSPTLLFMTILCAVIITSGVFHDREDAFFAVFAGAMGLGAEMVFVWFGAWSYGQPSFLGVPLWLPLAYATFALQVRRLSFVIIEYRHKKSGEAQHV
jgi:hypothetical protein